MTTIHTGCGREVHHGGCTCKQDAEIAALEAEVAQMRRWGKERNDELCAIIDEERKINARLRRALAAGPAALRASVARLDYALAVVERAQAEAMKEEP